MKAIFIYLSLMFLVIIASLEINRCNTPKEIINDNPILVVKVELDTTNYPTLAKYTVFDKNHYTWSIIDSVGKFKAGDTLLIIKK